MQSSVTAALICLSALKFVPDQPTHVNKIGQAAFVQSGTNKAVERAQSAIEGKARFIIHEMGISDKAVAAALIDTKVIKEREVSVRGPQLVSARTRLTLGLDHGTLGITWRF